MKKIINPEQEVSKRTARVAGLWYLLLAITAGFSWMYVNKTFIAGDAILTTKNIISTECQYLLSIICNIVGQLSFIFLVLTLYRLFEKVNKSKARIMLTLVLVSVPVMFVNIIFQSGALIILSRADYMNLSSFDQIAELVTIFLHLYIIGVYVVDIFWGLWLFPLAYLVYKSNYFPQIIALVLIISGGGYIVDSISFLIAPELHMIIAQYLSIPEALGELVMLFWLLIKGISTKNLKQSI